MPLRAVFEGPTIAQMSQLVENIQWVIQNDDSDSLTGEREEIIL
jgi:hypothetical protein